MNAERDDGLGERVIIPISKDMLARIEDFRFGRRIPSRAEAMRRLIEAGLRAENAFNPGSPEPSRRR